LPGLRCRIHLDRGPDGTRTETVLEMVSQVRYSMGSNPLALQNVSTRVEKVGCVIQRP